MTSRLPNHTDEYYARMRYPIWYRSLQNYAQILCRDLDQTGALWMVAQPHEWDTHPANTIPATSTIPNIPALVHARPTMIRPPCVLEHDASQMP
jgi:hypothetical protein